jgi:hypothetical protein
MKQYISDDMCAVALAGLRYVSKEDISWSNKTDYVLEISYKGGTKRIAYGTEKMLRDSMFAALAAELNKSGK